MSGPTKDNPESKEFDNPGLNAYGKIEIPRKLFNISDFTIYLRHLITSKQENIDMELFMVKGMVSIIYQNLVQSDQVEILKDYLTLSKLKPGQEIVDHLQYFEGMDAFIESMPIIPAKLEDFMVEFDVLVHDWKIETLIGQEDGRPFAYELDHKFMDAVYDQSLELTFIPYDAIVPADDVQNDISGISNGIGGFSGNLGLDSSIMSLATIAGIASKSLQKGSKCLF